MPLVKNTDTGNNYLVKINTDSDTCSRTAIRSYNKQFGSDGSSGRTRFTLPFQYDVGSHTLWVFVNGHKMVVDPAPIDNTKYLEYSSRVVQFGAALASTDVLEFIVAGSYLGEEFSTGGGDVIDFTVIYGPGNFYAISGDTAVMVDTTGGNTTIVLPLTVSMSHILRVVKISSDANIVTVIPTAGDTIEGSASILLTKRYDAVSMMAFSLQSVWIEV